MNEHSPKTRPQVAQRWPRGSESQRRQIHDTAQDGQELVDEALAAAADNNPLLVRAHLAMIRSLFADIRRLAVEARIGPEEDTR